MKSSGFACMLLLSAGTRQCIDRKGGTCLWTDEAAKTVCFRERLEWRLVQDDRWV